MMSSKWVAALARYNQWMNDKLYELAGSMSDEDRKQDRGAFFRSIHSTFNHILLADRVWMGRFSGAKLPSGFMGPGGIRSLDQELYADFDELRRERTVTDQEILKWSSELTDERLAAPFQFVRRGKSCEYPLWWTVSHFFNHQTHHRGQVTTLFNQMGIDPGVTDLFAMLVQE